MKNRKRGQAHFSLERQAVNSEVYYNTPQVQYGYGGTDSRLTNMTYPNGRNVQYNYGAANSTNDRISRLSNISEGGYVNEGFTYLGLSTVVVRSHPQAATELTYVRQGSEAYGDAGDIYTGLDRFGRVVDQRWVQGNGTEIDRFQYGYDRNSNRLWRDNLMNAAFGELYGYDNLGQLTSMQRGELDGNHTGLVGNATRSQDWAYDPLGNWNGVTTDGIEETRTHDAQNRVVGVGNATLTFDTAGNMLTDEQGQQYKYDAWNRLKTVWDSGNTVIASYGYDALRRRVTETHGNETKDLLYSSQWQVLEERDAATGNTTISYAWSPVYIDAMIERDRDTDGNGSLDERLWVQQDANWNVTSVMGLVVNGIDLSFSWQVQERYAYDAYGVRTVLDAGWSVLGGSSVEWRQGFQGMMEDEATGLLGSRFRDGYSATLGRWIASDPIKDGVNWYVFVNSNPLYFVDPSGLEGVPPFGWTGDKNYRNPGPEPWWMPFAAAGMPAAVFVGVTFAPGATVAGGARLSACVEGVGQAVVIRTAMLTGPAVTGALAKMQGCAQQAASNPNLVQGLYNYSVTRETLIKLANGCSSRVQVFTRLSQSPQAGRTLSVSVGDPKLSKALPNTEATKMFSGEIPGKLIDEMKRAGLVIESQTTMGGVIGTELQFQPNATEFILKFLKEVAGG